MGFFGRKRAPSVPHPRKEPRFDGPLTLKRLEQIFQDCVDFTKRPVSLGEGGACTLTLCYLSGMVKMERVSDYVLRPLAQDEALARCGTPRQAMEEMMGGALYNLSAAERTTLDEAAFDTLCARASRLIDRHTFGRAGSHAKVCTDCAEALAMACASIVQSLERAEAARAATGYAPGVTASTTTALP